MWSDYATLEEVFTLKHNKKTNAARILDDMNITYRIMEYEVDENDLSGIHIAECLQFPKEQMFKTLVARGDKTGPLVFCIPVALEIDLRRAAALTGNKKVEMIHVKDLLGLTGYIRGGCSPIGMKKQFLTTFDSSALSVPYLIVSGGKIGSCKTVFGMKTIGPQKAFAEM